MRGSVYALAKQRPDEAIEAFALRYTDYLLDASPAATRAETWITERPWDRVEIEAGPPPLVHAGSPSLDRPCPARTRGVRLSAGLDELYVLKTTGSAFAGFLEDRYTTLPATDDRIMATNLEAEWRYGSTDLDFGVERAMREGRDRPRLRPPRREQLGAAHAVGDGSRRGGFVSERRRSGSRSRTCTTSRSTSRRTGCATRRVFVVTDKPSGGIEGTVRRTEGAFPA